MNRKNRLKFNECNIKNGCRYSLQDTQLHFFKHLDCRALDA